MKRKAQEVDVPDTTTKRPRKPPDKHNAEIKSNASADKANASADKANASTDKANADKASLDVPEDDGISRTLSFMLSGNPTEVEDRRLVYLRLVDSTDGKRRLKQIARHAVSIASLSLTRSDDAKPPQIFFNDTLHDLLPVTSLGRKHELCDIVIATSQDISRLQSIFVVTQECILIVDVGSLNGTHVVYMNQLGEVVKTHVCIDNPVLRLPRSTCAKLSCGGTDLLLNPRDCVICYERKRNTLFDCGHFLACNVCIQRLPKCPVCRQGRPLGGHVMRCNTAGA